MSAQPLPVSPEESTTMPPLRLSTMTSVFAFACAAVSSASAEENSVSPKDWGSRAPAGVRAFPDSAPSATPTAPARAEMEGLALLAHRAYANPLVAESLEEFEELDEEAAEMEVAPPGAEVKRAARRILTALAREFPRYYLVSPGDRGDICIQASAGMGKGRGVLVVCDEDGVVCFVTMDGNNRRARYDREAAKNLPDEFMRAAMRQLG